MPRPGTEDPESKWALELKGKSMRKLSLLILGIIVSAALFSFVSQVFFGQDEEMLGAQDYVRKHPLIIAQAGQIKTISLRRYVSVQASVPAGHIFCTISWLLVQMEGQTSLCVRRRATKVGLSTRLNQSTANLGRYPFD